MNYKIKFQVETIESKKKIIEESLGNASLSDYTVTETEDLDELLEANPNDDCQVELVTARMTKTILKKPKSFRDIIELLPEIEEWFKKGKIADLKLLSNSLFSAYFSVFLEKFITYFATYPIREEVFIKIVTLLVKRNIKIDSLIEDPQNMSIPFLKVLKQKKISYHLCLF